MSTKILPAALAASLALASASSALAGAAPSFTASASPTSKTPAQSVDLTMTAAGPGCEGDTFQFFDVTGGLEKGLCGTSISTASPYSGTCTSSSLTDSGTRTLEGRITVGVCQGQKATTTVQVSETVPTTSEWTLWGMMGAMLIGGGLVLSRRFRRAA